MYGAIVQSGTTTEVFEAVRDDWTELFEASDCSPFLSWEWMSTWFESFGAGKTPIILKAYQDDKLIGILPLAVENRSALGLRYSMLTLIGDGPGGADHLDVLSRTEHREETLRQCFSSLGGASFDLVCLDGVSIDSAIARFVAGDSSSAGRYDSWKQTVVRTCPRVNLAEGWNSVLSRSKRAANFKRRLKQINRDHQLEFRSVTEPEDSYAAFDRFLALHDQRWRTHGGSELSGHPRLRRFQGMLIPKLSKAGLLRFDELWLDGECRSSIYGMDDGRCFYHFNAGFDQDYRHLSVGLVLLGLSIKAASERGCSTYDFLQGDERYKFDWADSIVPLVRLTKGRDILAVRLSQRIEKMASSTIAAAKSVLPSDMTAYLAAWRRSSRRNSQL